MTAVCSSRFRAAAKVGADGVWIEMPVRLSVVELKLLLGPFLAATDGGDEEDMTLPELLQQVC